MMNASVGLDHYTRGGRETGELFQDANNVKILKDTMFGRSLRLEMGKEQFTLQPGTGIRAFDLVPEGGGKPLAHFEVQKAASGCLCCRGNEIRTVECPPGKQVASAQIEEEHEQQGGAWSSDEDAGTTLYYYCAYTKRDGKQAMFFRREIKRTVLLCGKSNAPIVDFHGRIAGEIRKPVGCGYTGLITEMELSPDLSSSEKLSLIDYMLTEIAGSNANPSYCIKCHLILLICLAVAVAVAVLAIMKATGGGGGDADKDTAST